MIRVLQVMGGMNRRGAESFIMNVYRKIDRSKIQFDFLVYSNKHQDFEDEIVALGGRVLHMECPNGIMAYKSIPMIKDIIRKYGPYKAIHAQTLFNICFPLLAAKYFPEIVRMSHSHSTKNRVHTNLIVRFYEWLSKKVILKYTQVMFACGEPAGEYLFGEKFKTDGIILKNGIDLDVHATRNKEAESRIRTQYELDGKLVIGSVARFDEVKNHAFMVNIAEALKKKGVNFKMLFIGNGDLMEKIFQQIMEMNLQNFIAIVGLRNDIPDMMHVFDLFLMPSHFEGNPVTLVEAQAAGLPCVITDNISDEMDMGLGLVHRCSLKDSPEVWAEAVLASSKNKCADDVKIRKQIVANGFDAQTIANQLMEIYLQ